MFRHDPKRTGGGQRAAVFAVELVESIAINNQLPLVAARQVEVAHQAIPRIVFIAVARVVHTRPIVAPVPRVVLARITPSSIAPSVACFCWLSVKDARAVCCEG